MTGVHLNDPGVDPLSRFVQQSGVDGLILGGNNGPARFISPGGMRHFGIEIRHIQRDLRITQKCRIGITRITGKACLKFFQIDKTKTVSLRIDNKFSGWGDLRKL